MLLQSAQWCRYNITRQWVRHIHVKMVVERRSIHPVSGYLKQGIRHGETRSFLSLSKKWPLSSVSPVCCGLFTSSENENGSLIYCGTLATAVRGVKMFSYSTSAISLLLMPHILIKLDFAILQTAFCGLISFFTFFIPIALHLMTKGYVVRLYHEADRDIYTAITYNVLLMEKRFVFHQTQVRIPAISKMFTTFYAGKRGLLVNPDLFSIPQDYNHLMGYDKPFNFNNEDVQTPDKN